MARPVDEVVEKALELAARSSANYRYFFEALDDPEWVRPLAERGFFTKPQPPQRSGDQISFPFWPESAYLARMAKHPKVQQLILELALSLKTENTRIHEDLAEIALSVSPQMAARLAPSAKTWLESPYIGFRLVDGLVRLVEHLSHGGEVAAALDLARNLLDVVPGRVSTDGEADILPIDAVALIGTFPYERALEKIRPTLVATAGVGALTLFLDLLDKALTIARGKDDEAGQDYSFVWCPMLEGSGQDDVRDILVAAARDTAEKIAADDSGRIPELVGLLEAREWAVCRRLALHLLRTYPQETDLIAARLRVPPARGLDREYELLAKKAFAALDADVRAERLALVRRPNIEQIKQNHVEVFGETLSDEQADIIASESERDELAPLADGLPPEWRERYETLLGKVGPALAPGSVPHRFSVSTGPGSPKSLADLREMTVDELIGYAAAWQPETGPIGPSREGLGRILAERIALAPAPCAEAAERFLALDPTYVRAFFEGLWDGLRNDRSFEWAAVLHAARWVLDQPRDIPGRRGGHLEGQDPGWGWCRTAVARLVSDGLNDKAAAIPAALREDVASILAKLMTDPVPTPDDEAKALSSDDADPATLAMNTTRGEAMAAVFRYILWVRRALPESTLRDMPEIVAVLDRHLDVRADPSLAIRAVFGRYLPTLFYVDSEWTAENLDRILPRDTESVRYRRAAWDGFVSFSWAHDSMLDALWDHYGRAVDDIPPETPSLRRRRELEHRLVEHLCLFYAHGRLDLSQGGLFARLLDRPRPDLRAYALEFIGRSLGALDNVPSEVIDRFVSFSTWYSERYPTDRASLGWWAMSERFHDAWMLDQMLAALTAASGKIDPVYGVLERLADFATVDALKCIECLRLIVEGEPAEAFFGMEDQIRGVLERVHSTANPVAQEAATRLINRLGHLGYIRLRDLAPRPR